MSALLQVGVITGAHGVRGLVRVKSFTEDPYDLTAYGALFDATRSQLFELEFKSESKGQFLARLAGVEDRNAADALKGVGLFIERAALPDLDEEEEGYYHADLIGLSAILETGADLGAVKAVHDFGAGVMLEIATSEGDQLFPFTDTVVPEVDIEGGTVTVVPPQEVVAEGASQGDKQGGEKR